MALKAKIEAIIYAAEEPITIEQISVLVKDMVLAELAAEQPAQASSDAEPVAVSEAEQVAMQDAPFGDTAKQPNEPAAEGEPPAEAPAAEVAESIAEEPSEAAPANEGDVSEGESTVTEPPADEALATEPLATEAAATEEPTQEPAPLEQASVAAPEPTRKKKRSKDKDAEPKKELSEDARVRAKIRAILEQLTVEYSSEERGMEIRQVAGGYRMATKPEHHDVVRAFAKSLKPPVRLSLAALETLAVIAYKQPITVPEISEIRGVESGGVIGTLLDRKLITTAGRKQVIGRPILYKTSKEFLLRFGLNDLAELPSMEEFEKLAADGQGELFIPEQTPETATASTATAPVTPASGTEPQSEAASEESPVASPQTAEVADDTADETAAMTEEVPAESEPSQSSDQQAVEEAAPEPSAESGSEQTSGPEPESMPEATGSELPQDETGAEGQSAELEPEQADVARHE